jgi:hypothetical protein
MKGTNEIAEVQRQLRDLFLERIGSPAGCEPIQAMRIEMMIDHGDMEGALFEAKTLADVCLPQNMGNVTALLTKALKAVDGHVARINKYYEFQKFGKAGKDKVVGNEDDLEDPLAAVKCPNPVERDAAFAAQLEKLPKDWEGRMARANLCWYWGKPRETLKELKTALALCPVDQKTLQAITDRVTVALVQVSGDREVAKRFVEFQKHGPAGADGKAGTPDDITDPLAEYTK